MLVNPSLILGIIQNIALLIATSLLIDFFWTRQEDQLHLKDKILTGLFLGFTGIALMLTPWVLVPGLAWRKFRPRWKEKNRPLGTMLLVEPDSGLIIDANHAAARFYGYIIHELTQKHVQDINSLPREKAAEARWKALLGEQSYIISEHTLSNGDRRMVEIHSSPINFHEKTVLFSILHDITERKLAEEAMSHELRTPLNAIIGFSSIMNVETRVPDMLRFAEIIHNSGNHLLSIIESIFDVALLQSGEYKINNTRFPVDDLLHGLTDYANIEKKKRKKEHLLIRFIPPSGTSSPHILTDRSKLMQLITNLLNNAIKYTLTGSIEFGYKTEGRDWTWPFHLQGDCQPPSWHNLA